MKFDFVNSLIAVAISALLAYAFYEICDYERVQWVITIGAFITIAFPALFAMGISAKEQRGSIMLKTLSYVFFVMECVANGIFVFFDFQISAYVIVNGLFLLLYLLLYNSMYKKHM